ncbi:MAG: hypothetical protein JW910_09225 [Anaerolineae bacterium]|nr:hypothetical protein [Anaerolineae bacterium]
MPEANGTSLRSRTAAPVNTGDLLREMIDLARLGARDRHDQRVAQLAAEVCDTPQQRHGGV